MPSASSCSPAAVPCRAARHLALMAALACAALASKAHAQTPTAPFGAAQTSWTIGAAPPPVSYLVAPSTTTSASTSKWRAFMRSRLGTAWAPASGSMPSSRSTTPACNSFPPPSSASRPRWGCSCSTVPACPAACRRPSRRGWRSEQGKGSASRATSTCALSRPATNGDFRGFARSVFIGSTVGIGAGYAAAVFIEPSPKTSLLLGSSVLWGTAVGSMFGYGGSKADSAFGDANDSASLGGLIGYNTGMLGQRRCRPCGSPRTSRSPGCGSALAPVSAYRCQCTLLYAGGDHDPRRGLILQGTAGTLGPTRGSHFHDGYQRRCERRRYGFVWAKPEGARPGHRWGAHADPGGNGISNLGLLF